MTTKFCNHCQAEFTRPGDHWDTNGRCREYKRWHYQQNKARYAANHKLYVEKNRDQVRAYVSNYITTQRRTCPQANAAHRLRSRLKNALRGYKKDKRTLDLLGCSLSTLVQHLNQTAMERYGISYLDNPTMFHIDHIKPLCAWDLTNAEQLRQATHWTNLQALTAADNLSKHARLNWYKQ